MESSNEIDGKINKKGDINKNIVIGVTGTVLLKIISFVTIILVGYVMSEEQYGNLSTYNTWIIIFSVFVGLQFGGSLQNALLEYEKERYHSYCFTIISFAFLTFLVPFVFSLAFKNSLANLLKIDPLFIFLLFPQCFFAFLVNFMTSYFLSQKKVKKNLIWTLSFCVASATLSLLFSLFFEYKEFGYSLGIFIPNFIMGSITIVYFIIKSKFKFNVEFLKFGLLFSLPLVMHMLGSVILGQSDKIMIRFLIDEVQTGQYTMTHNYAMLINAVWAAFNGVFVPYYYENLKEKKYDLLNERCKNYYIFFSCISFGFILVGREIVRFIVDEKFYDGLVIFEVSVLAQFFIFLYSFCVNYEFYRKKTVWIAIGTIITAIINILLNFWFITIWGIFGAALASTISYLFLIIFHEFISRVIIKEYPISIFYNIFFVIVASLVTLVSILLRDFWIIRWVIGALIGIFLIYRLIKTKRVI